MKKLITLFLIFACMQSFSQEQEEKKDSMLEINKQPDIETIVENIPEVKEFYDQCKKDPINQTSKSITDCLWEDIEKSDRDNGTDLAKQITKRVEEITDKASSDVGAEKVANAQLVQVKKKKDKAIENLEKYYSERLSDSIYGTDFLNNGATDVKRYIKHEEFHSFYESAISKNILSAFSSFCIDAEITPYSPRNNSNGSDPNSDIAIKVKYQFKISANANTRKEVRARNIKEMPNNLGSGNSNDAATKWGDCASNIQNICALGGTSSNQVVSKYSNLISHLDEEDDKKDRAETIKRACQVTAYVKKARTSLLASKKIEDIYKENAKRSKSKGIKFAKEIEMYDTTKHGSIDKLTSTTSNEIANDSDFAKGNKEKLERFNECYKDNTIQDSKVCEEFMSTNHDKSDELLAEYRLRQEGLDGKIKALTNEQINDNNEEVKKYLKEQGFDEDQIEEKLANDEDYQNIKREIKERFEAEKSQLYDSLAEELDKVTSTNKGVIEGDQDGVKLEKIHQELTNQTDNYVQLLHYNNIVTAFLEIKSDGADDSEENESNTLSAQRELANSAYDKSSDSISITETNTEAENKAYHDSITEKLSEVKGISPDENPEDSKVTNLQADQLNKHMLKYDSLNTQDTQQE